MDLVETREKWKAKERKQPWGLPGRGDMEHNPEIGKVKLGIFTRTKCLRKLRDRGKKYRARDGRAALPLQPV